MDNSHQILNTSTLNTTASSTTFPLPTSNMDPLDLILLLTHLILVLPVITTNTLILLALIRFHHLQTPTNIYVGSLALTDLLAGVVGSPSFAIIHHAHLGLETRQVFCVGSYIFSHGPTSVSMLTLLAIAIERFVAVHWPYFYQRNFSIKVAVFSALGVWLYAWVTIITVMVTTNKWHPHLEDCNFGSVGSSSYKVLLMGHMVTTLIVASVLYIKIARVALFHTQQIATQKAEVTGQPRCKSSAFGHLQVLQNARIARMLATVLGLFYLCWLPYLLTLPFAMMIDTDHDPFWFHLWEQIAGIVVLCNSFVNFIVYAMKSGEFRQAFQRLLGMRIDEGSSCEERVNLTDGTLATMTTPA